MEQQTAKPAGRRTRTADGQERIIISEPKQRKQEMDDAFLKSRAAVLYSLKGIMQDVERANLSVFAIANSIQRLNDAGEIDQLILHGLAQAICQVMETLFDTVQEETRFHLEREEA